MNIISMTKGDHLTGTSIKKTRTMIVLSGKDMEESYESQIDWHTDIHL